jgi:hypothetical protein
VSSERTRAVRVQSPYPWRTRQCLKELDVPAVFSTLFGRDNDDAATDSSPGFFVPVEFTFHRADPTSGSLQADAATLDTLFAPTSLKLGGSAPLDSAMDDGSYAGWCSEVLQTGYLVSTSVDPTGVGIGIPCVISAHVFVKPPPPSVLTETAIPAPEWGSYPYTANFTLDVRTTHPQGLCRNSVAITESTNWLGSLHYGSEDQTFHNVDVIFNAFPASNVSGSVTLTIGTTCIPEDPEAGWDYRLIKRVEATPGSGAHMGRSTADMYNELKADVLDTA